MNELTDNSLWLPEILGENALNWQLHNCKFLQTKATFDEPMSLLSHYDSLNDDLKSAYPLSFEQLKRMNELMDSRTACQVIGVPIETLKGAWHIKYVGRVVFFCESLQLAVRVHFSNTSKTAMPVYVSDKSQAWESQASVWRFFGVADILYKGQGQVAIESDDKPFFLTYQETYQALPAQESLMLVDWLNEQKLDNNPNLNWLFNAVNERVELALPSDDN